MATPHPGEELVVHLRRWDGRAWSRLVATLCSEPRCAAALAEGWNKGLDEEMAFASVEAGPTPAHIAQLLVSYLCRCEPRVPACELAFRWRLSAWEEVARVSADHWKVG